MPPLHPGRRTTEDSAQPSGAKYLVKDVLLTVKTQPLPSNKYNESVCCAGITADGEWVRMYPFVWFSGLPKDKQPQKYQWIRLPLQPRAPQDPRPESHKPDLEAMELLDTLSTAQGWRARNEIVLPMLSQSIHEMQANDRSLALIKPRRVTGFVIEKAREDWGPKKEAAMRQRALFGPQRLVLEKIPWKFSYKFICDDPRCKRGHKLAILDWEIFEFYKKMLQYHGFAMDKVMAAMKEKWLDQMWHDSRDSYLYIGTVMHKRFNSPVVLGVYWPPKLKPPNQTALL